jgi:hypothetical protein
MSFFNRKVGLAVSDPPDGVAGAKRARVSGMPNFLRTDLDHTARTFLGYVDDAKRREKVDTWMMSRPDTINWQAEIDEAHSHHQEVRFGSEELEQVRLLIGEHLAG